MEKVTHLAFTIGAGVVIAVLMKLDFINELVGWALLGAMGIGQISADQVRIKCMRKQVRSFAAREMGEYHEDQPNH